MTLIVTMIKVHIQVYISGSVKYAIRFIVIVYTFYQLPLGQCVSHCIGCRTNVDTFNELVVTSDILLSLLTMLIFPQVSVRSVQIILVVSEVEDENCTKGT